MPKARFTYTQGSLVVYTKRTLESRGTDLLEFIFANTADVSSCENGCCAENPKSSLLWADFICHIYFLWDRDTSHFHIGLDRLDDAAIRHNCIFSGCRKHELVYAKPKNLKELVEKLDEESDAYTDVEHDSNECIPRRVKECWFCGLADERTNNPTLKVLCLEDIDFWILRENKQIVPTWYTFVEEDIPMLCLVSHILAKALSEGFIDNNGYQERADPFFHTKLNKPSIKIRWKREWLHRPVSRETVNALGKKSNDPAKAAVFDSHSVRLGIALGLAEKMSQYGYSRGYGLPMHTYASLSRATSRHTNPKNANPIFARKLPAAAATTVVKRVETFTSQITWAPSHFCLENRPSRAPIMTAAAIFQWPARSSETTRHKPPPNHIVTSDQRPLVAAVPDHTPQQQPPVPSGKTGPCIFCGKRYARRALLQNHLEQHSERADGSLIPCPRPEYQAEGLYWTIL
ncbi:hypothetical protein H634G_02169 [Metarhizium anisopliae BRIP 53293]|uniref:C2H2-type domain-containing protein n=1 Tax=Metarhizium anisopliae BRIP 53293 TaxID=1291518 RepID=A0A0D9P8U4_METAN|nr:hypothetical protein H634G_02169 [Metarhizium anisopliae BRIP 53293]KJK86464.1 hypothetical protein H633G_09680 [Metarhizium anisopliae BRIP 53284]